MILIGEHEADGNNDSCSCSWKGLRMARKAAGEIMNLEEES